MQPKAFEEDVQNSAGALFDIITKTLLRPFYSCDFWQSNSVQFSFP